MLKQKIKKMVPKSLLKAARPLYHGIIARSASARAGFPSRSMVVVGVTGTAGKSTTVAMLSHILNSAGKSGVKFNGKPMKAGFSSTVEYCDGDEQHPNLHGMSMAGGVVLQKYLGDMVHHGCTHAVVECTSEGLAQHRHLGVDFDVAVIGNLTEAHLDSHGSFTAYRSAKGKLFEALAQSTRKEFFPKKIAGVNFDDYHVGYFLKFPADRKFGIAYSAREEAVAEQHSAHAVNDLFIPQRVETNETGSSFVLGGASFAVPLPGLFNAYNAWMAVATAAELGVDMEVAAVALRSFEGVEGRMQEIPNSLGIHVFVDYAPEPVPFTNALDTLCAGKHGGRLIHVFGATGGHRDVAKRFQFGELSAARADVIIVTNDDVYESDQQKIAADIATGIQKGRVGRPSGVPEVVEVLDRRAGIRAAIQLARPGDTVLITGKGNEKFLVLPGDKRIEWNEPQVVAEILSEVRP